MVIKAIPTVCSVVCKAFTQLGADPDLDLGAASQEKSRLENSQLLVCLRSSKALLWRRVSFQPDECPCCFSGDKQHRNPRFCLHVAKEISVHPAGISVLPRTGMIFGIWLKMSVQLQGHGVYPFCSFPAK